MQGSLMQANEWKWKWKRDEFVKHNSISQTSFGCDTGCNNTSFGYEKLYDDDEYEMKNYELMIYIRISFTAPL